MAPNSKDSKTHSASSTRATEKKMDDKRTAGLGGTATKSATDSKSHTYKKH